MRLHFASKLQSVLTADAHYCFSPHAHTFICLYPLLASVIQLTVGYRCLFALIHDLTQITSSIRASERQQHQHQTTTTQTGAFGETKRYNNNNSCNTDRFIDEPCEQRGDCSKCSSVYSLRLPAPQ